MVRNLNYESSTPSHIAYKACNCGFGASWENSCILAYAFFALKFVSTMHNVFLCIKVLLCCLQIFCVFVFKVHNFNVVGLKALGF